MQVVHFDFQCIMSYAHGLVLRCIASINFNIHLSLCLSFVFHIIFILCESSVKMSLQNSKIKKRLFFLMVKEIQIYCKTTHTATQYLLIQWYVLCFKITSLRLSRIYPATYPFHGDSLHVLFHAFTTISTYILYIFSADKTVSFICDVL